MATINDEINSNYLEWIAKIGANSYNHFSSVTSTKESDKVYIYAVGSEKSNNAFITKWDTNGNLIWQKKIGTEICDSFDSVISTIENNTVYIYAVGYIASLVDNYHYAFITKWDTNGNLIWQKSIENIDDTFFNSVTSTIEDDTVYIYAAGYKYFSTNNTGAFITKWDTNGNLIWQKKIVGINDHRFSSVTSTKESDKVYIYATIYEDSLSSISDNVETFMIKLDTNGNLIWQKKIDNNADCHFYSVTSTIENDTVYIYAVGREDSQTNGFYKACITKWDTNGNLIWQYRIDDTNHSLYNSVTSTIENDTVYIYAVGYEKIQTSDSYEDSYSYDAFITKWDTSGNLVWQKKIGSSSKNYIFSVTSTIENSTVYIYVVGHENTTDGNWKTFITKLNTDGNIVTDPLNNKLQSFLKDSILTVNATTFPVNNTTFPVDDITLPVITTTFAAETTTLSVTLSRY